jgi:hypothetical protein
MRICALVALSVCASGALAWAEKPRETGPVTIIVNGAVCPGNKVYIKEENRCGTYTEVIDLCGALVEGCYTSSMLLDNLFGPPGGGGAWQPNPNAPSDLVLRPKTWEEIGDKATCEMFGGQWTTASYWGRVQCAGGVLVAAGGALTCGKTFGLGCAIATVGGTVLTVASCVGHCQGSSGPGQ